MNKHHSRRQCYEQCKDGLVYCGRNTGEQADGKLKPTLEKIARKSPNPKKKEAA
jgi:hypothetical protein